MFGRKQEPVKEVKTEIQNDETSKEKKTKDVKSQETKKEPEKTPSKYDSIDMSKWSREKMFKVISELAIENKRLKHIIETNDSEIIQYNDSVNHSMNEKKDAVDKIDYIAQKTCPKLVQRLNEGEKMSLDTKTKIIVENILNEKKKYMQTILELNEKIKNYKLVQDELTDQLTEYMQRSNDLNESAEEREKALDDLKKELEEREQQMDEVINKAKEETREAQENYLKAKDEADKAKTEAEDAKNDALKTKEDIEKAKKAYEETQRNYENALKDKNDIEEKMRQMSEKSNSVRGLFAIKKIDLNKVRASIDEIGQKVMEIIGKDGISSRTSILQYFKEQKLPVTESKLDDTFAKLVNNNVLVLDYPQTVEYANGIKLYSLSEDIGKPIFKDMFKMKPVTTEVEYIKEKFENLNYGWSIKDVSKALEVLKYEDISMDKDKNTLIIQGATTWTPDIIATNPISKKKEYFRVEMGNYSQKEFDITLDKAALKTNLLKVIVPNKQTLEKVKSKIITWRNKNVDKLSNLEIHILTYKMLKAKEEPYVVSFLEKPTAEELIKNSPKKTNAPKETKEEPKKPQEPEENKVKTSIGDEV